MDAQLPKEFAELERFSEWVLPTSGERNKKRVTSTMPELKAFYDAMMKHIDRIVEYFKQFSMEEMPQDTKRLLYMTMSLVEVSHAVELYGQPTVIGGMDSLRFKVVYEPKP
ncbi:hypothetical protein [Candidatus Binatus sp.]|uniref:hypothetical protein n=1 Tax=Candidatus Binatus sp. TaxID=2811406 RepID=UPI003C332631